MVALLSHRKLKKYIAENNFKQEAIAEKLGISDRYIRILCNKDSNIKTSLLYEMSRAFCVLMEELLVLKEEGEAEDRMRSMLGAEKNAPQVEFLLLDPISYRRPMNVTEVSLFRDSLGETGYPVCPRCRITLEREFVAFCDRCGQHLGWQSYKYARIIYPPKQLK